MQRCPFVCRSAFRVALVLVALSLPALARPAAAQPCLNNYICGLVLSCAASATPTCGLLTGCRCVPEPCNNSLDCPNRAMCDGNTGTCAPSPEACSTDSECAAGKVCGSRAVCVTPQREPCSDAKCNDKNPCNGTEVCDGFECRRGTPPNCNDGNDVTSDYCQADSSPAGYRCENVGPSRCSASAIAQPVVRFGPTRAGGIRGFVISGVMATRFAKQPPTDLPSGSIRVMLFDKKGQPLVDTTVDPASGSRGKGGWTQDPKAGWLYQDGAPDAPVSRMSFRDPSSKRTFGTSFEVVGSLPANAIQKFADFATGGALIIDWTGDITGPCGAVKVPLCRMQRFDGADWMFCRERAIGR